MERSTKWGPRSRPSHICEKPPPTVKSVSGCGWARLRSGEHPAGREETPAERTSAHCHRRQRCEEALRGGNSIERPVLERDEVVLIDPGSRALEASIAFRGGDVVDAG